MVQINQTKRAENICIEKNKIGTNEAWYMKQQRTRYVFLEIKIRQWVSFPSILFFLHLLSPKKSRKNEKENGEKIKNTQPGRRDDKKYCTYCRIPFSLHLLSFLSFSFLIAYPINIHSPPFVIAAPGGGIVRVLHVSSKWHFDWLWCWNVPPPPGLGRGSRLNRESCGARSHCACWLSVWFYRGTEENTWGEK